jgi:hypothetical protein
MSTLSPVLDVEIGGSQSYFIFSEGFDILCCLDGLRHTCGRYPMSYHVVFNFMMEFPSVQSVHSIHSHISSDPVSSSASLLEAS